MTDTKLNLKYNANTLCSVEEATGKTLVEILAEMDSDAGISLSTLRALVAAGRAGTWCPNMPAVYLDVIPAGKIIDRHGTEATAGAVGKALAEYISKAAA